jgi:pimeloyl-ACP methyl ester carboxylesterase
MKKNMRLMCLAVLTFVSVAAGCGGSPRPDSYTIINTSFTQPVDQARPAGPTFTQQVDILIPAKAAKNAPVFFNLGNEHDLTDRDLVGLYNSYGRPDNVIFIQAEHRGYGQSVTSDADQSVPGYVSIEQALADYHRVVERFRKDYPGPWMGTGYSYGGGLVIHFAARYPEDLKVILSSSGVVDWPFTMDAYDRGVRSTFGETSYARLAGHIEKLKPEKLFDKTWLEREFLIAVIHGATQYGRYKALTPVMKLASLLPTGAFLRVLHWIDRGIAKEGAWNYATSNAKATLTLEEKKTGRWDWRVWRYQQCREAGVFEVSAKPEGIFTQERNDFIEECESLFKEYPTAERGKEWSPRAMVRKLSVPVVYVAGGMDPWMGLCLERDFPLKNGRYFYRPEGRHCPDYRDDPVLAREVLATMIEFATR